jgi:hypothetical protein
MPAEVAVGVAGSEISGLRNLFITADFLLLNGC